MYIPRKATRVEKQYIVKAGDLNAFRLKLPPDTFLAGIRRLRVMVAIPRVHIRMKPRIRMVQENLNP